MKKLIRNHSGRWCDRLFDTEYPLPPQDAVLSPEEPYSPDKPFSSVLDRPFAFNI
jgi:hypothetical protein